MKWNHLKLTLLLSCLGLHTLSVSAATDPARLFVWGLGGSEGILRADVLVPLVGNPNKSFFYTDVQGKRGTDNAWFAGAGLGYRGLNCNNIYGAYVFYDRDFSGEHDDFHDGFSVINPGIEWMNACGWDLRVNGYFPVGNRNHRRDVITDFSDTCGDNMNNDLFVFEGHQQFVPHFHHFSEVGSGADAEVGKHFCCGQDFSIYAGGYYYHVEEKDLFEDHNSIKGVEARVVLPLNTAFALTVEGNYDNVEHGAVVGGVRVQLGNVPCKPCCFSDRLYDPVMRNLGTVATGSGIPIVTGTKGDGLVLFRDNIWFFSSTDGDSFASGAGTFEDPLAADQFTQKNVGDIDALASNANLFFNTGTYVINPATSDAPNAHITLPQDQSVFGRTVDYKSSAIQDQRPTFLGGLNLSDNNRLDSIILTDAVKTTDNFVDLTALVINDAMNVVICNSDINADVEITGNSTHILQVNAIYANHSQVTIHGSAINAALAVDGSNISNPLLVTGIGGNNQEFVFNKFVIDDTMISSSSMIAVDNTSTGGVTAENYVTAIGGNTNNDDGFGHSANFEDNVFTLNACVLNSVASVGLDMSVTAVNCVTVIGGNGERLSATFERNQFTLTGCSLNSLADVGQNSENSTNLANVIGGNSFRQGDASFGGADVVDGNTFTIVGCDLVSVANIGRSVINAPGANFATVIGGQQIDGIADFRNNSFNIVSSNLSSTSHISKDNSPSGNGYNFATVIGGQGAFNSGTTIFADNEFLIDSTRLESNANIGSDNQSINFATVIGGNAGEGADASFDDNTFVVTDAILNSTAEIGHVNIGHNLVTGIGGNANFGVADFINNSMTVSDSVVTILANVLNANNLNQAAGWKAVSGDVNLISDEFFITAFRNSGIASSAFEHIALIPPVIVNDGTTHYHVKIDS